MRLGILLARRSHLKTLSPVIDASLARGHETTLVCAPIAAKKGDRLDIREVKQLWPEARLRGDAALLDVLVGLDGCLPVLPIKLVGVDAFFDTWLYPPKPGRTACYASDFHFFTRDNLWRTEHHMKPLAIVGWLPADQAKWIAPAPRDCAVFFTLKLDVPEPWRTSPDGRAFYRDVFEAARAQARADGLKFIVKSRAKNKDPWWVWWYADEYVVDECMVPYTSLSLLARARWAVHFESGAALECALMGAYGYVLNVPQTHVDALPGAQHIYWRKGQEAPRMHCWPGVTQYGVPTDFSEVDPAARQAYIEHFIGPCDGKAGERVIDVCEG